LGGFHDETCIRSGCLEKSPDLMYGASWHPCRAGISKKLLDQSELKGTMVRALALKAFYRRRESRHDEKI
jgi:hypothetical protein